MSPAGLLLFQRNDSAAQGGDTTDGQSPVIRGIAAGRSDQKFVYQRSDLPGAEYLASELLAPRSGPHGLGLPVDEKSITVSLGFVNP